MMTAGSITPIFTRPLSLAFLLVAILLLIWPRWGEWRRRKSPAAEVDLTLE
jgi:putative tricarboxylic transport membrane protein